MWRLDFVVSCSESFGGAERTTSNGWDLFTVGTWGKIIPRDITRHLSRLASWSTDLRYATGPVRSREAEEFIASVVAVAAWAEGRM